MYTQLFNIALNCYINNIDIKYIWLSCSIFVKVRGYLNMSFINLRYELNLNNINYNELF